MALDLRYPLRKAFLAFLDAAAIPVAAGIPARDGIPFFVVEAPEGPRPVAVFRWAPGVKVSERRDTAIVARVGEIFARMHLVGARFVPSDRRRTNRPQALRDNLPTFLRMVGERLDDLAFYPRATKTIARVLEAIDLRQVPFGPNHGDFHASNVHVDPAGEITLLDFDNSGEDFYAQDIACYLWANSYVGYPDEDAASFIAGYE